MNRIILMTLLFYFIGCDATVGNVTKIKDPIFPEMYCHSNDIRWEHNKLVTDLEVADLTCEQSGYTAFVFGEDSLNDDEVERIKVFLQLTKKIQQVEHEYDFTAMSVIDHLWMIKNIYELRDLTPEHHAKVLSALEKPIKFLLRELETEKKLLQSCDLEDDQTRSRCHVFTIKNRLYETYGSNSKDDAVPEINKPKVAKNIPNQRN